MSTEAMKLALDHLINLQPILGNGLFEERQLAFIDPHIDCAITALQEALAQPQQEPVAGLLVGQDSDGRYVSIAAKAHADTLPLGEYKLYTSSPAQEFVCSTGLCHYRKPLTREVIERDFYGRIDFVRLIEAAHGIKDQP